jgi:GxxExxY protein
VNHKATKDTKNKSNLLSKKIIGAAIEVQKHLGAGLLEPAYEQALCCELCAFVVNKES